MDCWVVLITDLIDTADGQSATSIFCIYYCSFQSFLCTKIRL